MQEVLTVSHCVPHILCRGLARIRCVHELPQIIHYLSLRHYINGGMLHGEIRDLYPSGTFQVCACSIIYEQLLHCVMLFEFQNFLILLLDFEITQYQL